MQEIADWNGSPLLVRYSRGASRVPYVEDWQRNVLGVEDAADAPGFLTRQVRAYVARRAWFSEQDALALSARLGRISKFQSLRSEDAVTWSWFGTLARAAADARRASIQWLYDFLDVNVDVSDDVAIRQWVRVPHPNVPGRVGPEVDAIVDDRRGPLIYVEAKWRATLGTGRGVDEETPDDQIVLRCRALGAAARDESPPRVVLGISVNGSEVDVYQHVADETDVVVRWLTWTDLATCHEHPQAQAFSSYLAWKQRLTL
jgi:hypothetical protein